MSFQYVRNLTEYLDCRRSCDSVPLSTKQVYERIPRIDHLYRPSLSIEILQCSYPWRYVSFRAAIDGTRIQNGATSFKQAGAANSAYWRQRFEASNLTRSEPAGLHRGHWEICGFWNLGTKGRLSHPNVESYHLAYSQAAQELAACACVCGIM